MAYSALVSLEKVIDQILNDDRYSISPNGKQHIISLDKHVISFSTFLEDFPEKAAKNLEARIRDVAMKAEDIIEWFMNEQIRHYVFKYVNWTAELRRIMFEFQLRKVRDQMDAIAEMKNSIITKDAKLDVSVEAGSSPSQVADAAGKMKMVGLRLNEDLIEIMDRLCRGSRQLQIVPITGMGGIGKTTLARNAYNDQLIMEHFQIRVWITISQNYSEKRILSDLLDSMKEFLPERRKESEVENSQQADESVGENFDQSESLAEMPEESNSEKAEKVYKILYGRRFLIVMDDTWSTEVMNDVNKFFPDNKNGSRILLTTRLRDVADSSTPSHEMRLMDADQSWNLLEQKVLGHQDFIPRELEKTGREIARSCGGLPLAVVVVAGLLSRVSTTQTSWEEIARNVKSSLATTEDGQIEKILSLSYNHLPHYLRPCFLYMGGFPEDHEIKVMNLIRLWIAEGFVKPVTSKSPEDSAEEYMEDLIKRNLVVVSKSKSNGKIKSCSLHDLVRDLCIKQSQEEKFLVHVKGGRALKRMKDERRISISCSENVHSLANYISSPTIRTIMYFHDTLTGSFGSFRLLRVLDVLRAGFGSRSLPDQFFELFHLRYLAFCYDGRIPRAIYNLQNLQTLIIRGDHVKIWNMPPLRHLILLGQYSELAYLDGTDTTLDLENLQTLGKVRNLSCSLSLLHMIPNLRKLSLIYSMGFGRLLFHNLVHLHQLEKLKLELRVWTLVPSDEVPNLVLPSSLKKLSLIGWGGSGREPYLNIVGPFPNLQVLKLRKFNFMQQEWITSDQDFPKLRFLLLDESDLKHWNSQGSHFPMLENLLIHSCSSLNEIPDDIGEILTLKLVEVKDCSVYLEESVKLIQEEQLDYGDDVFQVRCSNSFREFYESFMSSVVGFDQIRRMTNEAASHIV